MEDTKLDLTAYANPKSPIAEAYRTLRTNLSFASVDKKIKAILITSSLPNEGKSTVVCNFAHVMAQSGMKVLVVDCDMRNPSIHKLMGIKNQGLSNILSGQGSVKDYIQNVPETTVDFLAGGPVPPNPSELLVSKSFLDFLQEMTAEYDYVMLDTPPVLPVTDAAALATRVDACIFVVESGRHAPKVVVDAKKRLEVAGAFILGVVLNKFKVEHNKSYGYGYGDYTYYSYYSSEEK